MSADDIRAELAALRAEVAALPALRAEVAALRAEQHPRPVTSWRGVAEVVGVSEDTVARRRREAGDRTRRPWFSDPSAVREWWAELHAGPSTPAPTPTRRRSTSSSKPARTTALRARDLLTP